MNYCIPGFKVDIRYKYVLLLLGTECLQLSVPCFPIPVLNLSRTFGQLLGLLWVMGNISFPVL